MNILMIKNKTLNALTKYLSIIRQLTEYIEEFTCARKTNVNLKCKQGEVSYYLRFFNSRVQLEEDIAQK